MFWIIIQVPLIAIFGWYIFVYNQYWKKKGVKHKFSLPPLGENFNIMIKKIAFYDQLMSIYNRFPDERYTGLYQFTKPILMLRDPQLIKQLCVKDFEYFLDHFTFIPEDADPLWSKNLFALTGQKWRDMRSTLSPSFTGSKMRQMFVLMDKCAENFISYFSKTEEDIIEIELKDTFTRYGNDIIATTAFGIQCDSLKDRENEFYVRGKQTTNLTGFWKTIKFMLTFLMPGISKVFKARIFDKEVSAFFRKIVKETVEYRENNHIERPDMINLLMHAKKGTGTTTNESTKIEENSFAVVEEHLEAKHPEHGKANLSLDDITSQALIFFFAGFDSVSTAMCFMAYELAINPDIQQRLIEELDDFRAMNNALTYDSLNKLEYLDMVLSETLRKWPPNIVTDRQCVKPYTIKPEFPDEKPVNLTTVDSLWVPIWALHHDPKYWNDPNKFDPERFSSENKSKITPYTYLPFGVGPRNCIGSRFAIMEVKAIFCGLLAQFEIIPIEKSCIPFKQNIRAFTLSAEDGFWFGLKKRKTMIV